MKFSQRTDWSTASNPLIQSVEEKRRQGASLIDLTQSNPTRCDFRFLKEEWLKPLASGENLVYEPDPHGLLEARRAISAYYAEKKIQINPSQIFLTASTSEAYTFIFRLLCDARDLIAVPRPSYPLFDYLTALSDVDVLRYFLAYGKDWRIAVDSLEIPFIENPKALILVNPNNPTGNFVKPDDIQAVNRLCQRSATAIISDEVFLDFVFDARKTRPSSLAGNEETLTFTLSGASKILGLPQMKLSWIVVNGPLDLKEKAIERLEIIADTYLSVNTPSQRALKTWMDQRETARREMVERCRSNFQYLQEAVSKMEDAQLLSCEGGWYAILKLRPDQNDEALALRLLEDQNLIVYPGYFFDFGEGEFLVTSLLLPPKIFSQAVERLCKGLV